MVGEATIVESPSRQAYLDRGRTFARILATLEKMLKVEEFADEDWLALAELDAVLSNADTYADYIQINATLQEFFRGRRAAICLEKLRGMGTKPDSGLWVKQVSNVMTAFLETHFQLSPIFFE